jgi:hypothetical protein
MTSSGPVHRSTRAARSRRARDVEQQAKQRISEGCPYAFYFRGISYHYKDGVLTLTGRVPTYYLKQILQQRLLSDFDELTVENKVDVVNARGLSSVSTA